MTDNPSNPNKHRRINETEELNEQLKEEKDRHTRLVDENHELEKDYAQIQRSLVNKVGQKVRRSNYYLKQIIKISTGKRYYKDVFDKEYKKKKAKKRIKQLRYRLYDLGFEKEAVKEFNKVIQRSDNQFLVALSAWELVNWFANKGTISSLHMALEYLKIVETQSSIPVFKRKMIIMQSEIYDGLGMTERAIGMLRERISTESHIDLYFALANLQKERNDKIEVINQALERNKQLPLDPFQNEDKEKRSAYDRLQVTVEERAQELENSNKEKVSVIMPMFNAEANISTAIESLLLQTWENMEIIVVDDCSTDRSYEIVQTWMEKDLRVKAYQNSKNAGPYVARNRGLDVATGDFVTVHDADDWSHPEKIAYQAKSLLANPKVLANTSLQARLTENLHFHRRGKAGAYAFSNMSSLMFKREAVIDEIGYWDSVRFGADAEFKKRLIKVFGEEAVQDLKDGIYSFQRQTPTSLTGSSKFGYHGFFMGARKEYLEAYTVHHNGNESLKYSFPQATRPFPVPEPMKPNRTAPKGERRHFDVIIASEFRLLGGTNMSNIEEIKAQKQHGYTTGLLQLNRYDLNSVEQINPKVREQIDGDTVQMLVYGEEISCDVLVVRHPPALQHWQKYLPDVQVKTVHVIVNQPPKRDYSETGKTLYRIEDCLRNLRTYFGQSGTWYPIGPEIRKALETHHHEEIMKINIVNEDWVNIINVEEWKRNRYVSKDGKIRIGRHSRDQYVKWPETRERLEQVYPSHSPFEIHVLGGAESPKKTLGELPQNWVVKEFGQETPQEFLENVDVFVYYTHSDWVEAFGRVIFEAMAAGVPVVIQPKYEALFREAAIYAEPEQVKATVEDLVTNKKNYEKQVKTAQTFVEENFGYTKHIARLRGDVYGRER